MKRLVSILLTIGLLVTLGGSGLITSAQRSNTDKTQDPFAAPRAKQKEFFDRLPEGLKRGATPEAKAAWESLTPQQREQVKAKVNRAIEDAKVKFEKDLQAKREQKETRKNWKDIINGKDSGNGTDITLRFTDKQGGRKVVKAKEQEGATESMRCYDCEPPDEPCYDCEPYPTPTPYSTPTPTPEPTPTPTPTPTGEDADGDGLPESFENQVADAFTPIYHVSAYDPYNFATFGNSQQEQDILQRLGPNPFSYFRVTPLGFAYNNWGQLVSVLRIDYLTLWDRDGGVVTGGECGAFPGLTSLQGFGGHPIDNERSAALVAAPVYDHTYNLDPWAYSAYSYYTAAHEGESIFDKSRYVPVGSNPVPAGWHLHLALSLSKHGTYTFNPDYYPFVPEYLIYSAYAGVAYACYDTNYYDFGWSDAACLAALYYLYGFFYDCAVERFIDQGGQFAATRVNIGEPNMPLNGAYFIQDDQYGLYSKLVNPVF